MRTKLRLFILSLAVAAVPVRAAPPPSVQTKEELLWGDLRVAARLDAASEKTSGLLRQFLKEYPDHPKAVNVRYMLAERPFRKGDYKSSAVAFEAFLRDYPQHPLADSAAFRLGESYYNLKVYNSAYVAWETLVKTYKDSALLPDADYYLAILHMKRREWGKADERMKDLQAIYPHFVKLTPHRENHGVIQYHLGEYTDAVQTLQGIDWDKGSYYRGLAMFQLKLYEDAVGALKQISFTQGGPYVESAAFLKAESYFQKRNYTLASSEFKAFLAKFPASGLFPHAKLRSAACALLTKDAPAALSLADEVLARVSPPDVVAYAWFIRGSAALEQNAFGPAAQAFAKVSLEKNPDLTAAALVREAWCRKKLGETAAFEAGLKTLSEKYASTPQMPLVHFLRGALLFEQKKWEDAGTHLEAGLIRYPYSVLSEVSLALMAVAYTEARRPDELVTSANAALKILEGNYSTASPYWRAQSHFFIGKAYFDLKKFKEAIPYLEKVTINFSDHDLAPSAQLLLAWCLSEAGQPEKAAVMAVDLTVHRKASAALVTHARFLRAVAAFNAKDYEKALAAFAEFVKANPKHALAPQAQYLTGLAYHQKRVYGSAVDAWTACVKDYPDHPLSKEAYLQVGDVYFKAGQYKEAADFFKKFHARWPTDEKFGRIALWQELQSYFNGKDDESGVKSYPLYFQSYPDADNMEDAKKQLEMIYYRRGASGDPAKLEEFLKLYPLSPFAPQARYKLGEMATEQEKWTLVAQHMELFVRDYPKDPLVMTAHFALANALQKTGDLDRSIVQFKSIMGQYPDKPVAVDASFRLAMIHFGREKYQEALDAFQYALTKRLEAEAKANVHFNMALCYENLGKPEEAAKAYGAFADVSKNKEQVREALLSAGILLRKAEKYALAVEFLSRYVRDPGSPEGALQAVNLIAECHSALGDKPKTAETYERLVSMDPAPHDLRLTGLAQLAYLYEQEKDFSKAIRIYEKIAVSEGKADWVKAAQQRVQALTQSLNQVP